MEEFNTSLKMLMFMEILLRSVNHRNVCTHWSKICLVYEYGENMLFILYTKGCLLSIYRQDYLVHPTALRLKDAAQVLSRHTN